jgi:hypothetical protein
MAAHQWQHEKWDAFVVSIARTAEMAGGGVLEEPQLN